MKARDTVAAIAFWGTLLVAWEAIAILSSGEALPRIYELVESIAASFNPNSIIASQDGANPRLIDHILITSWKLVVGTICGVLFGTILALVVSRKFLIRRYVGSAAELWEVIPPLIAVPILISVFGSSSWAMVGITALFGFVLSVVYVTSATLAVPEHQVSLAKMYGAGNTFITFKVVLPNIWRDVCSAARVTFALALGVLIIAEYLGFPSGIGRVMKYAVSYNRMLLLITCVVWSVFLAIVLDRIAVLISQLIENRFGFSR